MAIIKDGVSDGFYGMTSFEKFVTREISSQVHKMVTEKYVIKVEEKNE